MSSNGKRKVSFPITSRAYYGRSQLLLGKLHQHPFVDLELMLGGSILLDKYSRHIADDIKAGGFTISASLFNVIEGGNHVAMAAAYLNKTIASCSNLSPQMTTTSGLAV